MTTNNSTNNYTGSPLTTKGDLYGYSSTGARIPVGGDTQSMYADSSQTLGIAYDYIRSQKRYSIPFWTDFAQSSGGDGWGGASGSSSGTGAGFTNTQASQGSNSNRFGVMLGATGSTNTGWVNIIHPTTNSSAGRYWYPGYGSMTFEVSLQLTQLSNGTDRFNTYIGFMDAGVAASITNGIYFYYEDDVNSGKWQLIANNATVLTTTNSTTAADTSYHRFKVVVNAAGTLATFYIDDVSVGTVASGFPTAALAPTWIMTKTVGTTSVTTSVDWMFSRLDFTTPR